MNEITISIKPDVFGTFKRHGQCVNIEPILEMEGDEFAMTCQTVKIAFDYDTVFDIDIAIGQYLSMAVTNERTKWIWQTRRDLPNAEFFYKALGDREHVNPIRAYCPTESDSELDELYSDILGSPTAMKDVLALSTTHKTKIYTFVKKLLTDSDAKITFVCNADSMDISDLKKDAVMKEISSLGLSESEAKRITYITTDKFSLSTVIGDFDELYMRDIESVKRCLTYVADSLPLTDKSIMVPSWKHNMSKDEYVNVDHNLLYAMLSLNCSVGSYNPRVKDPTTVR